MHRAVIFVLLAMAAGWAHAASFQVNPVRVTLSARQSTAVLRVTNSSDTPTVVQLQIEAWSQENGQDVYTPSRKLLATPPIFTIAPGNQQVVRIGMRAQPDAKQENTYRLFLTEVPPAPKPGYRGVQIALRVGIPIFVLPAIVTGPVLQWSAKRLSSSELAIQAFNNGTAHAQILNLTVNTAQQSQPLAHETGGYVLLGSRHTWTLKLKSPLAANTPIKISAETDRGTLHAQLVPGK